MLPEPANGGGRRFLLTGVVSRYQLEPSWNREELTGDLQRDGGSVHRRAGV